MKKGIFLTLISLCFMATGAKASYCDLNKLEFGMTQQELKEKFEIDALDVAETGDQSIISGAEQVCEKLPESGVVRFSLIDNKFVQMQIENENKSGKLFEYATKIFGERDNKDEDEQKQKDEKIKLGLWTKDDGYNVVYTLYSKGGSEYEKLSITSSEHKELFSKINEVNSKAINENAEIKK